jgi:hypothetical protein
MYTRGLAVGFFCSAILTMAVMRAATYWATHDAPAWTPPPYYGNCDVCDSNGCVKIGIDVDGWCYHD